MDIASLPKVECAILHNQFNPLDNTVVIESLQRLSGVLNFAPKIQLMDTSNDTDIHVHVGGYRILISQNAQPAESKAFKNALTTPYTSMVFPNADDVVARHQATTLVTIARGLFDLSPEAMLFKENSSATSSFNTYDEALRAMVLCRELVKLLIVNNPAAALHWCPSDNLVSQDFFERNCEGDMMLLNIRPFLASKVGAIVDGKPMGMVVHGSPWLIGRQIEFVEACVSFPWMMEAVLAFITLCHKQGSIPVNLDSYGLQGAEWRVGVEHEPAKMQDRWDKVKLVPVHVPEFGFLREADTRFADHDDNLADVRHEVETERLEILNAHDLLGSEPSRLNPDNSMDHAILEQLRKRQGVDGFEVVRSEEEKMPDDEVEVQNTADVVEVEEEVIQVPLEPWNGNPKKADIDALRELAKAALNPTNPEQMSDKDEASLLGKLGGMFGKR